MTKTRIITALVMLTVLGVLLYAAPLAAWAWAVWLIVLVADHEWANLSQLPRSLRIINLLALLVFAVIYQEFLTGEERLLAQHWGLGLSLLFWLAIAPLWMGKRWQIRHPLPMIVTGWIAVVPTALALISLRELGPNVLLLTLAVLWISDSMAYFSGKAWGRNRLAPEISPGKTWEGVAGALAAVSLYGLVVWQVLGSTLLPSSQAWLHSLVSVEICGVAVAILGIEGDLMESWLKRCAGVKDSGHWLPGHGGVLDRVDALLPTVPLAAWLMGSFAQ
jgi:phosphatidate cytidylyltransferase